MKRGLRPRTMLTASIFFSFSFQPINKVDLNERHGAHLKSEKLRIKAAGGKISADGAVYGVLYPTRG